MEIAIRPAVPDDAGTIHRFVSELAAYEREPDAVEATPETFRAQLAAEPSPFEALIAEVAGEAAGFALFFQSYSTWLGKPGLYLEDLYVTPTLRGRGVGRALFARLASIAVDRGYGRLEWAVLDWNEPAIGFYRGLGASPQDEWTTWRLTGDALRALGEAAGA